VYQTAFGIDANMCFYAEVPLVAFLLLLHIGVAFVLSVLRRGWCVDDRGANDA
jgi:hypothetical protein